MGRAAGRPAGQPAGQPATAPSEPPIPAAASPSRAPRARPGETWPASRLRHGPDAHLGPQPRRLVLPAHDVAKPGRPAGYRAVRTPNSGRSLAESCSPRTTWRNLAGEPATAPSEPPSPAATSPTRAPRARPGETWPASRLRHRPDAKFRPQPRRVVLPAHDLAKPGPPAGSGTLWTPISGRNLADSCSPRTTWRNPARQPAPGGGARVETAGGGARVETAGLPSATLAHGRPTGLGERRRRGPRCIGSTGAWSGGCS